MLFDSIDFSSFPLSILHESMMNRKTQKTNNVVFFGVGQAGSQIISEFNERTTEIPTVLVDSESKVIQSKTQSKMLPNIQPNSRQNPSKNTFPSQLNHISDYDKRSVLFRESGCGNNFFNGQNLSTETSNFNSFSMLEASLDALRYELEKQARFDSICLVSGLGGGTGSGFGSKILSELADRYPSVIKSHLSVFPDQVDNGPMSVFNTILALSKSIEFTDLQFYNLSTTENSEIVDCYLPIIKSVCPFEAQRSLTPLNEAKIVTAACVTMRNAVHDFGFLDKVNKAYKNKWHPDKPESLYKTSSQGVFLELDAKRDSVFAKMEDVNWKQKLGEIDVLGLRGSLNLQKRKIVVYKNSNCFIDKLAPIVNSCKWKMQKGAYVHHFDQDQILEIEDSVDKLKQLFYFYKHGI